MMFDRLRQAKLTAIVVLGILTVSGYGADWPGFRGPDHNGISSETQWSTWDGQGPKVLWKKNVGVGFSSFAAVGNRVITLGNNGKVDKNNPVDTVYCYNAETGQELWHYSYPCPLNAKYYIGGTLSTPRIDGERVYIMSKMGELHCLKLADGKLVWKKDYGQMGYKLPTWHVAGSPVIIGDRIYLNLGTAGVALNKADGGVIWDNGKGACGYSTPVPYDAEGTKALLIAGEKKVFCVAQADGKILWSFDWETRYDVNAADPIFFDDYVLVSSGYNHGCGLFKVRGSQVKKVWESKVMRNQMGPSVLYQGHLYGFDENQFKCVEALTGEEKWADKSLGKGAVMMSSDGRLIVCSDKSELAIVQASPASYQELARAAVLPRKNCWTVPVLANGRIFVRNQEGDIAGVKVGP